MVNCKSLNITDLAAWGTNDGITAKLLFKKTFVSSRPAIWSLSLVSDALEKEMYMSFTNCKGGKLLRKQLQSWTTMNNKPNRQDRLSHEQSWKCITVSFDLKP